jgi:cytochrome c peroxidase
MMADGKFHNHGVPSTDQGPGLDRGRTDGIPQLLASEFNTRGRLQRHEQGRSLERAARRWTPTWAPSRRPRCATSQDGPYMHTGGFANLWDVVNWYNQAAGTDGFSGHREAASAGAAEADQRGDGRTSVEFLKALDGDPLPEALTRAPALP